MRVANRAAATLNLRSDVQNAMSSNGIDHESHSTRPHFKNLQVSDDAVEIGMKASQKFVLGLQKPDGHFVAELIVDSTLCSDYVLYMHWRNKVDKALEEKCIKHILKRQLSDGGWNIYYGGPSEINASVKAYFSLKLSGLSTQDPRMVSARANILRLGGIPNCNTYAKLTLALLGQFPWEYLPIIPAEIALIPDWFYMNIYQMSSWTRAILMPMAIINHHRPVRRLPEHLHLHELYPFGSEGNDFSLERSERFFTWRNFFLGCDRALKWIDSLPWKPFRAKALLTVEAWILERVGPGSDGLGAIMPAMLNTLIALEAHGYPEDHPVFQKAQKDFEGLFVDEPDDFRIQPCLSPVGIPRNDDCSRGEWSACGSSCIAACGSVVVFKRSPDSW